jgi:hypothetical protein
MRTLLFTLLTCVVLQADILTMPAVTVFGFGNSGGKGWNGSAQLALFPTDLGSLNAVDIHVVAQVLVRWGVNDSSAPIGTTSVWTDKVNFGTSYVGSQTQDIGGTWTSRGNCRISQCSVDFDVNFDADSKPTNLSAWEGSGFNLFLQQNTLGPLTYDFSKGIFFDDSLEVVANGAVVTVSYDYTPIPEPRGYAVVLAGGLVVLFWLRSRRTTGLLRRIGH